MFTNVSFILPVPFVAALLIPVTAALLQANVVPEVVLVAVYVNALPLVVVAVKLLDRTGIGFGAATPDPAEPAHPLIVCVTV